MNRKILNKIILELDKPEPNISYIRGILETVMDNLPEDPIRVPLNEYKISSPNTELNETNKLNSNISEASILEAKARAALDTVKMMSKDA